MNNLHLLTVVEGKLNDGDQIKYATYDDASKRLFAVTEDLKLVGFNTSTNKITFTSSSLESEVPPDTQVVGIQHIPDNNTVCLAMKSGEILTYDLQTSQAQLQGCIDSGICAMKWSPDFEIVVLVTGAESIMLMSQEWETINEIPLVPPVDPKPGEVGIARKVDLSFQPVITWRMDGEYFAVSSVENGNGVFRVYERSSTLHSTSEAVTKQGHIISWRPTGDLIVSEQIQPNKHDIIFYERNGLRHRDFQLRDDGKLLDLKWNSGSDILTVLLQVGDKTLLQLWHRNNYHWYLKIEIKLDFQVAQLLWENESPMDLHVVGADGSYRGYSFCWDVDATEGNYQHNNSTVAVIDGAALSLSAFKNCVVPPPMSSSQIVLKDANIDVLNTGKINQASFSPSGECLVLLSTGVVVFYAKPADGFGPSPQLLGYQLNSKNSEFNLSKIGQVVFVSSNSSGGCWVGVQHDTDGDKLVQVNYQLGKDTKVVTVSSSSKFPLKNSNRSNSTSNDNGTVYRLSQNKNSSSLFVQLRDGSVWKALLSNGVDDLRLESTPTTQFPQLCPSMTIITLTTRTITPATTTTNKYSKKPQPEEDNEQQLGEEEEVVVGLTARSKLYWNATLISAECTSYAVHSQFFMFTTLSHVLRFMSLHRSVEDNLAILQEKRKYNDTERDLETGAKLVIVTPLDTRVVLQMPRGNLETIDPRALTVATLRSLISSRQITTAFTIMRRHRIDLNLLYDHDPKKFLGNVPDFVTQIKDVDHLNLFINGLVNEDVTRTKFIDPWKTSDDVIQRTTEIPLPYLDKIINKTSKINVICSALFEYFTNHMDKYILSAITSLVKFEPPKLEDALNIILKLREGEIAAARSATTTAPTTATTPATTATAGKPQKHQSAESVLKYLIFLVDVNDLYQVALGMYNFDLVLLVAKFSQKDPKEYLPFLADLHTQDKYLQRFNIDMHLQRYSKAIRNLSMAGDEHFEKCLQIIQKHNLYGDALRIYEEEQQEERKEVRRKQLFKVMEIYADKLSADHNFVQAGLLYSTSNNTEKAIIAYRRCGHWRKSLYLAQQSHMTQEKITALATEIAEELQTNFKYSEAAVILESYCGKPALAVKALVQGNNFDEAIRIAYKHNLADMVETEVKKGVEEHAQSLITKINNTYENFIRNYNRLLEVRFEKLTAPKDVDVTGEDPNWTDTSSMASTASTMTSASSYSVQSGTTIGTVTTKGGTKKKYSKQGRKKKGKISGRKGSPMEEEYLYRELRASVPSKNMQEEIKDLLRLLVFFHLSPVASTLQSSFSLLIEAVKLSLTLINTPKVMTTEEIKRKENAAVLVGNVPVIDAAINPFVEFEEITWKIDFLN